MITAFVTNFWIDSTFSKWKAGTYVIWMCAIILSSLLMKKVQTSHGSSLWTKNGAMTSFYPSGPPQWIRYCHKHHSYEYYMILVKQLGMTGWNIFNPHVNSLILRNVPFRPTKRTILHVLFWIIRALCVTWCGWHILFIRFSNVSSIQRFQPSSSCFAFNIFGKEFKKVTVNISFEKS